MVQSVRRTWLNPRGASQRCAWVEYQVQQPSATTRIASPPLNPPASAPGLPRATMTPPSTASAMPAITLGCSFSPVRMRPTIAATTGPVASTAAAVIPSDR